MAVVIETELDRATLIECIAAPRRLLATYNEAAQQHNAAHERQLALWSPSLLDAIAGSGK